MDRYKLGFFVSSALLIGSLGYQLWPRGAPVAPIAEVTTAAPPASTAPRVDDARLAETSALRRKLAACQSSSWELVAKVVAGEERAGSDADPNHRRRALEVSALALLRQHWWNDREGIVATMRDVGSEAWVQADIDKKIAMHRARFGLTDADATQLTRGYRGLWKEHGERMQAQVASQDWESLLDEAKRFWEREDQLVESTLGIEARDQVRVADADARTAVLAMVATVGEIPWDEALNH